MQFCTFLTDQSKLIRSTLSLPTQHTAITRSPAPPQPSPPPFPPPYLGRSAPLVSACSIPLAGSLPSLPPMWRVPCWGSGCGCHCCSLQPCLLWVAQPCCGCPSLQVRSAPPHGLITQLTFSPFRRSPTQLPMHLSPRCLFIPARAPASE